MSVVKPDFASLIARFLIDFNAVGYDLLHPIKWASGTYNPFYVDNRRLQSSPGARKVLRQGLASLVEDIEVDYVYGIPKAGIAPAVLLSLEINRPLLIKDAGRYYEINTTAIKNLIEDSESDTFGSSDIIIGTMPLGTVLGIILAEVVQKPFLFVREAPKNHGLGKQVEGIITPGDSAFLVDPLCNRFTNYTFDAVSGLQKEGIEITSVYNPSIDTAVKHIEELQGKKIIAVEDLISTGGSSLDEIKALQKMGACTQPCSIFSYDLPSAVENFKAHGLVNKSVLNFEKISSEFDRQQLWKNLGDKIKVENWYQNQGTWGQDNGFI